MPVNGTKTAAGYIGSLMWNLHDRTLMAQVKNGLYKQAGEAFAIRRDAAEEIPSNIINDDAYLVLKAQIAGTKVRSMPEKSLSETGPLTNSKTSYCNGRG